MFCIIFLIKQYFTIQAIDFHWSHINNKKKVLTEKLLKIQFVLTIFLGLGFLTEISAIIIYFIYVYTFIYSSNYGLEETYYYVMLIFMVLSSPIKYSLDIILGIETNF